MTLREKILEAKRLDEVAAVLDRRLDQAKERAARAWLDVHEQFEAEGYEVGEGVTVAGTRYGYEVDWYAQVQDAREFVDWAEDNAPHYIQPQIRKALLNQAVQAAQEDGRPLDMPGVGQWPKRWVSKRAAGSKK